MTTPRRSTSKLEEAVDDTQVPGVGRGQLREAKIKSMEAMDSVPMDRLVDTGNVKSLAI